MATGIGLAVTNSKAVIEAIVGKQTEFVRTRNTTWRRATKGGKGRSTAPPRRLDSHHRALARRYSSSPSSIRSARKIT